jgi:hypothetical protein
VLDIAKAAHFDEFTELLLFTITALMKQPQIQSNWTYYLQVYNRDRIT